MSVSVLFFFRFLDRQSHDRPDGVSYVQSIKQIVTKDGGGARGAMGVLGRGLGGRMAGSALQVKRLCRRNPRFSYQGRALDRGIIMYRVL